jgi:hypothetical protein
MPVIVEPMGGGPAVVVYVHDHTDTALLLTLGARFPRLGEIDPLAEPQPLDEVDATDDFDDYDYDKTGWS